jgi:hypothetical protein
MSSKQKTQTEYEKTTKMTSKNFLRQYRFIDQKLSSAISWMIFLSLFSRRYFQESVFKIYEKIIWVYQIRYSETRLIQESIEIRRKREYVKVCVWNVDLIWKHLFLFKETATERYCVIYETIFWLSSREEYLMNSSRRFLFILHIWEKDVRRSTKCSR